MGDVVDEIEAADVLRFEQIPRVALLLPVHRHQQVAPLDLGLFRGLGVNEGPLDDAVKTQGLLRLLVRALRQRLHAGLEELLELVPQSVEVAAAVDDGVAGALVLEQHPQQMLDADELVPPALGLVERRLQHRFPGSW